MFMPHITLGERHYSDNCFFRNQYLGCYCLLAEGLLSALTAAFKNLMVAALKVGLTLVTKRLLFRAAFGMFAFGAP